MRIKADGKTASDVRYTQAVATASAQTSADDSCNTGYGLSGTHSHLTYADGQNRYWDDAFGRDTKLTVYAVAIPDKNNNTLLPSDILDQESSTGWYTVAAEKTKIDWTVPATQLPATRLEKDLAYSNNIKAGESVKGCYRQTWNGSAWAKTMEPGQMIWQSKDPADPSVTVGQFDKGHLVFKHALSWLTIKLTEGSGFDNTSTSDFKWTNNNAAADQSITLKGFPTSGKLDLSNGEWSDVVTNVDITQLDEVSATTAAAQTTRQLEAIVLPGTNLYTTTANVIEFEIDNAKYYVSGTQIANAIRDYYKIGGEHENYTHAAEYRDFTTMKEGKRYYVNLTVSKKGIDNITAAILDWETVNSSEIKPDNVYCSFNFEDRGTRLVSTDAAYSTTPATKSYDTDHWKTTDWFWPNNKTYYHFRAAGTGESASGNPTITTDATGDYFPITSGTIDGGTYKDYVWGAPFKVVTPASSQLIYSTTTGFDNTGTGASPTHQISQAIGATNSQIKMLLFHMTSQIKVNVSSVTGDGSVTLIDGDNKTKVEILNFLPDGKVLMGTGAVSATDGTRVTEGVSEMAYLSESTATMVSYAYGIVPQPLIYDTTGRIGLCITTPDGNKYYVRDLSTCTATVSSANLAIPYSGSSPYIINAWYPHYKYTYNITLSKAGVKNITAAVLDWETVESTISTPITLEN